MRILGLIPARAGSKGIPGKSIRMLAGKPLIEHTLQVAMEALGRGILDEVIVSTDCPTVTELSNQIGISVPFVRPDELSSDTAKIGDVAIHALDVIKDKGDFDAVMLLQPTSPLRSVDDIEIAINVFEQQKADLVFSVSLVETHHPFYMYTLDENGTPTNFHEDALTHTRRQDFPPVYERNGAIYLISENNLRKHQSFYFGERIRTLVMPQDRSVNIDSMIDFEIAEAILRGQAI
jgi:CMP-N,N'-diacetyllegionaminic acid synthase